MPKNVRLSGPIVVHAIHSDRCVAALVAQGLTAVHVDQAGEYTAPLAYMRTGYEVHLLCPQLAAAVVAENGLRARGARIVNRTFPCSQAQRKDVYYPALRGAGIPVPDHVVNPSWRQVAAALEAGVLTYPFVYRAAAWSGRRGMALVRSKADFGKAAAAARPVKWVSPENYLAVRYVDTRAGGKFLRYSAYVFGGRVDACAVFADGSWNGLGRIVSEKMPPEWAAPIIAVGKVLGIDVYKVDLVRDQAGRPYIVDVNPTYFLLPSPGDPPRLAGHLARLSKHLWDLSRAPR